MRETQVEQKNLLKRQEEKLRDEINEMEDMIAKK